MLAAENLQDVELTAIASRIARRGGFISGGQVLRAAACIRQRYGRHGAGLKGAPEAGGHR